MISRESKKIAVLVLGYNSRIYLQRLLTGLLRQKYGEFSVTYIDNASADSSASYVAEHFPSVELKENAANLGFTGGFNRELGKKFLEEKYDAAVLLNSDIIIDDDDFLGKMVRTAYSDTSIGIVQPKIYIYNREKRNIINTLGNAVGLTGLGFLPELGIRDDTDESDRSVRVASGACLLIKNKTYRILGGFDKDFFAYMEDVDLSLRAQMRGIRIALCGSAYLWHLYDFERSETRPWKFRAIERNRYFTIIKNYPLCFIAVLFPLLMLYEAGMIFHACLNGWLRGKVASSMDVVKKLPLMLKKRKKIQKNNVLSNKEFLSLFSQTYEIPIVSSWLFRKFSRVHSMYYHFAEKIFDTEE